MYTRIHQYERTNTHTQTCNCTQLGLSIYAIESQNMHTNHICSATSANINDVWPHMKRQRENKKNNKKLKCCAGFFCFGQNVIHLHAAAARTAHKADLKASLLHSMTFNHFACVCVAHMNLLWIAGQIEYYLLSYKRVQFSCCHGKIFITLFSTSADVWNWFNQRAHTHQHMHAYVFTLAWALRYTYTYVNMSIYLHTQAHKHFR